MPLRRRTGSSTSRRCPDCRPRRTTSPTDTRQPATRWACRSASAQTMTAARQRTLCRSTCRSDRRRRASQRANVDMTGAAPISTSVPDRARLLELRLAMPIAADRHSPSCLPTSSRTQPRLVSLEASARAVQHPCLASTLTRPRTPGQLQRLHTNKTLPCPRRRRHPVGRNRVMVPDKRPAL